MPFSVNTEIKAGGVLIFSDSANSCRELVFGNMSAEWDHFYNHTNDPFVVRTNISYSYVLPSELFDTARALVQNVWDTLGVTGSFIVDGTVRSPILIAEFTDTYDRFAHTWYWTALALRLAVMDQNGCAHGIPRTVEAYLDLSYKLLSETQDFYRYPERLAHISGVWSWNLDVVMSIECWQTCLKTKGGSVPDSYSIVCKEGIQELYDPFCSGGVHFFRPSCTCYPCVRHYNLENTDQKVPSYTPADTPRYTTLHEFDPDSFSRYDDDDDSDDDY